jgi:hypothetical protein
MEQDSDSSSSRALPQTSAAPADTDESELVASEIARLAQPTDVVGVAALTQGQVPPGRDRAVGVPVLVAPTGSIFVLNSHSHAAVAREALTAAGASFDPDFPDRTLGGEHGWVMVQAASAEGVKIQLDRTPTRRQREVIDDLLHYAGRAGHTIVLHHGRPVVWVDGEWAKNPHFAVATDHHGARRLLTRQD